MTDIVLVHSSDLHVDNDPHQGPYGEDGTTGLRVVLEAAKAHDAHFVLLVGDVFDNNRQPAHILDRSTELLAEAGRPVLILPGNHDPVTPDSVYLRGEMALALGRHEKAPSSTPASPRSRRRHRPSCAP